MTLLEDFKKSFQTKYNFLSEIPIGSGAYGTVFKAIDVDRGIPVAVKIFQDGAVPVGSERGWMVTSKIINSQISSTFTIESFKSGEKEFKAVISRFIPGKSLKEIFDWANEQSEENRLLIADDLVSSFLLSLLNILELCHSLGYGHGDLHTGNIMATLTKIHEKFEFTATLIDFDNSSIKDEAIALNEREKIEKDCRSFTRANMGIGPYLVMDWQWAPQVNEIFSSYSTIRDLKIAFIGILKYVDLINKKNATTENTFAIFNSFLPYVLNEFSPAATIQSLRSIANVSEFTREFESAFVMFTEAIRNPDNLDHELVFIKNGASKNTLYKSFFLD